MQTQGFDTPVLNRFFKWLSVRLFSKLRYDAEQAERLRQLAQENSVVYIQRAKGILWHLALIEATKRYALPYPVFVGGVETRYLASVREFFRRPNKNAPKKKEEREQWLLEKSLDEGDAAEIFLRRPASIVRGSTSLSIPYVNFLLQLQRKREKAIVLLPHVLILRSRPAQAEIGAADILFGTTKEPGFLRSLFRLILSRHALHFELADTINLKDLIAQNPHLDDIVLAKKIRFSLLKKIGMLEKVFYGPALKNAPRMRIDTLRDPQFQHYLKGVCAESGIPKKLLLKKARRYYDELAARFDIDVVRLLDLCLSFVWKRIYDGLFWNKEDIDRIRQAARKGPLVLVPSHKSHVDYLVMSQVLYAEGLMPPHIAAGNNLSFFPLGSIFRRGGAYFIRRSFKGDPLYPQVVKAYLNRLFKEGFTQEFFIEGGRSRSGKSLPPKTGLLSMMLECALNGASEDLIFVPASISYEKLVEASSYKKELEGSEKSAENASNLVKSAGVLNKRYGQVHVTFEEPISLKELLEKQHLQPKDALKQLPQFSKSVAHRILYRINQCAVITPTSLLALALLSSRRRALARTNLLLYTKRLIQYIRSDNPHVRISKGLEQHLSLHIDRALALLVEDQMLFRNESADIVYFRVNDKHALSLDYYKNNIIHHFVADAIVATAFVALGGGEQKAVRHAPLIQMVQHLSRIFKFEFVYPEDKSLVEIVHERLLKAESLRIIEKNGDLISLRSTRTSRLQLHFATQIMAHFVDAYMVCMRRIPLVIDKCNNRKQLVLRLLEAIQKAHLSGAIDCPESASKAIVENVLLYLLDTQIIGYKAGKPVLMSSYSKGQLIKIESILQEAHHRRMYG